MLMELYDEQEVLRSYVESEKYETEMATKIDMARACLKNAFCQMCVTICGRFVPNEGRIVGYVT
ncbi:MAG: hypothetical protein K2K74_07095 [Lachnospiraceae bacterium]|nr:hypothetical protein [Lachnospiraceae bacterium]